MRVLPSSGYLGLAFDEKSITAAEISVGQSGRHVRRCAEFEFAPKYTLEAPAALGTALGQFLRQHRFHASRCVIGVPARWLIARTQQIPPATPDAAANILRIHAERLASPELRDLVFDYAGKPDPKSPQSVLLVGVLRKWLECVSEVADAAGLSVLAITPSSLVLDAALARSSKCELLLHVGNDGVELLARSGSSTHALRHVSSAVPAGDEAGTTSALALGGELRRAVSLLPQNGHGAGPRDLLLWNAAGMGESHTRGLADRAGVNLRVADDLSLLGVDGSLPPEQMSSRFGRSVALAQAGADPQLLRVDFLHSRLHRKAPRRISRRTLWIAAGSAAVILLIGFLFWDVQRRQNELATLKQTLTSQKEDVKAAQALVDKVLFTRGWFESRPKLLECLRDVTLAFRDDEAIWVTNLTLREKSKGPGAGKSIEVQFTGKTTDQRHVRAVLDRLKNNNSKFADAKLGDMRDAAGSSREIAFTLNMTFIGVD